MPNTRRLMKAPPKGDPEREAMYAAVRAAPDDDLPRLVFADWLEERGEQDQADFIRHMVSVPRWGRKTLNHLSAKQTGTFARCVTLAPWREPQIMALVRRTGQRLDTLAVRNSSSGVIWNRGFMAGVHCSGQSLSLKLAPVLKRHPLQEVRLSRGVRKRLTDAHRPPFVYWWHGHVTTSRELTWEYTPESLAVERDLILQEFPTVRQVHYDHRPMGAAVRFVFLNSYLAANDLCASPSST